MQIKRIFNEIFSIGGSGGGQGSNCSDVQNAQLEKDLELLYAYIEAELNGEDASGKFPKVHAAIESSEEAKIQYQDLRDILKSERDGTLIIPDRVPTFDFSYLNTPAFNEISSDEIVSMINSMWRWDTGMGQLFVEFSEELIQSLRQRFSLPNLATDHLRSGSTPGDIFQLVINPQQEDLSTKFVARSVDSDESLCDITVTVERPSLGGAPLMADSRVDLMLPRQTSVESDSQSLSDQAKERVIQYTNPFGEAIFRQIAILDLPYLQFLIEPVPLRS